jgi:thiol-disulfide isomerase/thioredoxin
MQREQTSEKLTFGSVIPSFAVKNVDGNLIGSEYLTGAKAYLVGFLCNHCPYVKGSEQMLIEIVKLFEGDGLKTVTINSNDAVKYPEDSYQKMQDKHTEMKLPYPYLYDESQSVAKLFDAACTPEFYLFNSDRKLVYHGTINDSPRDPSKVSNEYLSQAIASVLEGMQPEPRFVNPLGCSIKWK